MDKAELGADVDVDSVGLGEYYLGLCLAALVLMVMALYELRLGAATYIPYIVFGLGLVSLWLRLSSGPPLLLATTCLLIAYQFHPPRTSDPLFWVDPATVGKTSFTMQLVLFAAATAYTLAYYRRLALEAGIFPADPRKSSPGVAGGKPVPVPRIRRDAGLVTVREFTALLFAVPAFCGTAYLTWVLLGQLRPPRSIFLNASPNEFRLLLLCWIIALGGTIAAVALAYLERARATPEENLLYLQEQLWGETVREQGRVNRWLVRARLSSRRRKETP